MYHAILISAITMALATSGVASAPLAGGAETREPTGDLPDLWEALYNAHQQAGARDGEGDSFLDISGTEPGAEQRAALERGVAELVARAAVDVVKRRVEELD